MQLSQLQNKLADQLRHPVYGHYEQDYFYDIEEQGYLERIRRINFWWRKFQLSQYSFLVVPLLRLFGILDERLAYYIESNELSPFIEEQAANFRNFLLSDPDPVIAAVAALEDALIKVRRGDKEAYNIPFDYEPLTIIQQLLAGRINQASWQPGTFICKVSVRYEGFIKVEEEV